MPPLSFDSERPAFLRRYDKEIAIGYRDECLRLRHEAQEAYCKHANARPSPINTARYEYAKHCMLIAGGMLAEARDIVESFN